MRLPTRVAYVLATGYILAYYSEWSFWSGRPAAEDFYLVAIPTWLLYSCLAYFFLAAVSYFRVKSIWAFFLAGAIYGWLGEGLYVQTMYDTFPMNISWTGLAWHSLISVLFGLVYLPKKLREGKALLPSVLAGLALGFWMIGWWLEPDVQAMIADVGDSLLFNVIVYNGLFGLLLIPAYAFWLRYDISDFEPTHIGFGLTLALALFWYVFVTIPTQPLALIVLPICMGLALFGLWKNRQAAPQKEKVDTAIGFTKLWPLLLIPFVSVLFYTAALIFGIVLPSLVIVLGITMPAGFILFGLALWRQFSKSPNPVQHN